MTKSFLICSGRGPGRLTSEKSALNERGQGRNQREREKKDPSSTTSFMAAQLYTSDNRERKKKGKSLYRKRKTKGKRPEGEVWSLPLRGADEFSKLPDYHKKSEKPNKKNKGGKYAPIFSGMTRKEKRRNKKGRQKSPSGSDGEELGKEREEVGGGKGGTDLLSAHLREMVGGKRMDQRR